MLITYAKSSILDFWLGFEYASNEIIIYMNIEAQICQNFPGRKWEKELYIYCYLYADTAES